MRSLLFLGLLAVAFWAFGCGSNPAGNVTGPAAINQTAQPVAQQQEFDLSDEIIGPPKYTELQTAAPPGATPEVVYPGFYGMVSNLNLGAGTFTLTSPSGNTLDVTATPGAQILYQGTFYDLTSSPLENGVNVSVTPYVSNLPEYAHVRATLIVINSSPTNQGLIAVE